MNPESIGTLHGCFLTWGGQWVQFFFMLSGFMMSYSRLCRPRPGGAETPCQVWKQQMQKLYPAYFLSLLLTVWKDDGHVRTMWRSFPADLALVFSWGWNLDCNPTDPHHPQKVPGHNWICVQGLNEPAWFLCALQLYWLAFPLVQKRVAGWSHLRVVCLLLLCWALTLFWPLFFAFHEAPAWGSPLATFQAFNPISHFHKFVFGMCTARIFVDVFCRSPSPGDPRKFVDDRILHRVVEAPLFALVGWAVLLWVFLSGPIDEFVWFSLSSYETILLPAFALLTVGLALERDPITWLLTKPPFRWTNEYNISYEIYILQGAVWETCMVWFEAEPAVVDGVVQFPANGEALLLGYPPILFLVACGVCYFVTNPVAKYLSSTK